MDDSIVKTIYIVVFVVVLAVLIYLIVDFQLYKTRDAKLAQDNLDAAKQISKQNSNYVIDQANMKNKDIYDELKTDVKDVTKLAETNYDNIQMDVNRINDVNNKFQQVFAISDNNVTGSGSGTGVSTTGLSSQSTTASGGTSISDLPGSVPLDVTIMSKVNAVNGITMEGDVTIDRKSNTDKSPMLKLKSPFGTASVDVAAGAGLLNLTSGASWDGSKYVYDGTRNSSRVLIHDDSVHLMVPTKNEAVPGEHAIHRSQLSVDKNGIGVANNAYVGDNVTAKHFHSRGINGWNWFNSDNGPNDHLYFGGDPVNRGIWSHGERPVAIYTQGTPRLSVNNAGVVKVNRSQQDPWPSGWGAGLHSWDVYANGSSGVGNNGKLAAYMNNAGVYTKGNDDPNWNAAMSTDGHIYSGKNGNWYSIMTPYGNIYSRNPADGSVNAAMTGDGHMLTGRNWKWNTVLNPDGHIWHGGTLHTQGDHVYTGGNNHIIHTPDDGRKTMYISPAETYGGYDWNWSKGIELDNVNNKVVAKGNFCVGGTCITEAQLQTIKSKSGV